MYKYSYDTTFEKQDEFYFFQLYEGNKPMTFEVHTTELL